MLVLSRHKDEELVINPGQWDEIVIVVVDIIRDKVRLGIKAPREIVVHRREVCDRIDLENQRNWRKPQ